MILINFKMKITHWKKKYSICPSRRYQLLKILGNVLKTKVKEKNKKGFFLVWREKRKIEYRDGGRRKRSRGIGKQVNTLESGIKKCALVTDQIWRGTSLTQTQENQRGAKGLLPEGITRCATLSLLREFHHCLPL